MPLRAATIRQCIILDAERPSKKLIVGGDPVYLLTPNPYAIKLARPWVLISMTTHRSTLQ